MKVNRFFHRTTKFLGAIALVRLALFLTSCVSISHATLPMAKFEYESPSWEFSYTVYSDSIVYLKQYVKLQKRPNRTVVPLPPGEAEKIVSDLLAQGVGDWLPDYGVRDGRIPGPEAGTTSERDDPGIWHLKIQHGGHSVVSAGRGIYPSDADPKKPVPNSSNRFKEMAGLFGAPIEHGKRAGIAHGPE